MVRPVSFKEFQKGFQGVSLRGFRGFQIFLWELCGCIKYLSLGDPACGTAGFLISAFKYIQAQNKDKEGNSTLSPDDKKRIMQNFAGYDISPDMVRLSRVNMYLHGFINPNISEYDTLTSEEKWAGNYDVIFANPPFMTPKGGIAPHSHYRVKAKRSEVLFVDYIAEHLESKGRAAVIVPEGIVFQSQTAYKMLRQLLVDGNYLYGVISLPAGVFNPYSGVKTSILLIDKALAEQKDSILFVKLNNDGFDLGAQRREIKGSEIPDVVNIFTDYQKGLSVEGRENVVIAKKSDIAEQEYILVGERYTQKNQLLNCKWPLVSLCDVCEFDRRITEATGGPYIGMEDIEQDSGRISPTVLDGTNAVGNGAAYLFDSNHILYGRLRPYLNKVAMPSFVGRCSTELIPIRPEKQILKEYLFIILRSEKSVSYAVGTYIGARMPRTDLKAFANFKIPLPPLTIQEKIVAEIKVYQKIIDGARQVTENYKPTVKINSAWTKYKLGDLCADMRNGVNVQQIDDIGKYRVTRIQTISDGTVDLEKTKWTNDEPAESYFMKPGDILLSHINSYEHLAKTAIFPNTEEKVVHGINLIRCQIKTDMIMPEYLIIYMKSDQFISDARKYAQRAVNQASIKTSDLKQLDIPVPPMEVQEQIVLAIHEEMSIVGQNKRLIEIFQQKIKDRIAEVWGE